ncbi:putative mitochondrial protein, partial [Mucuna pruriens]
MIVTDDDEIEKLTLKEKLTTQFEMKELEKLKLPWDRGCIFQTRYFYLPKKVCSQSSQRNRKIGMQDLKGLSVKKVQEKSQYQRLVGKLIYLSYTRSDIVYVVSVVSQFMHNPRERHLQEVKRILQYLKASLGKELLFRKEGTLSMEIYTDADYA